MKSLKMYEKTKKKNSKRCTIIYDRHLQLFFLGDLVFELLAGDAVDRNNFTLFTYPCSSVTVSLLLVVPATLRSLRVSTGEYLGECDEFGGGSTAMLEILLFRFFFEKKILLWRTRRKTVRKYVRMTFVSMTSIRRHGAPAVIVENPLNGPREHYTRTLDEKKKTKKKNQSLSWVNWKKVFNEKNRVLVLYCFNFFYERITDGHVLRLRRLNVYWCRASHQVHVDCTRPVIIVSYRGPIKIACDPWTDDLRLLIRFIHRSSSRTFEGPTSERRVEKRLGGHV